MGKNQSKEETVEDNKHGLFNWQDLEVDNNELIHFDPRYEDMVFHDSTITISDLHNRVFKWKVINMASSNNNNESKNNDISSDIEMKFDFESIEQYQYQKISSIGRNFDRNGSSLAWVDTNCSTIYYYEINDKQLFKYDISEWLDIKYGHNWKIPSKQIISFGNGTVIFMIHYSLKPKKQSINIYNKCDIVHMDVKNEIEIKTININCSLFDKQYSTVYWAFVLHPSKSIVTVIAEHKKSKITYLLFVSLINGDIIWQSQFDFIHDILFNFDGTYVCIFERPRITKYGYIHIMNFTRLEWLCQIRFTYGGLPLGWDSFTWCANCLVFVKPFEIQISSPGDLLFRQNMQMQRMKDILKMEEEQRKIAIEQAFNDDENINDVHENIYDDVTAISPSEFDKMAQMQKSKKICVLSVGDRWWDLNKQTMHMLNELVVDENIGHLILEYASLAWVTVEFPYPLNDNTLQQSKQKSNLLQGAMSEVFGSGILENCNILILGQTARDPKTHHFNHWKFRVCIVPKTFEQMWNNSAIETGVIGGENNDEESL